MMVESLLTADELAALLKIKRKSVYSLPIPRQMIGTRVRYKESDVRRFLDVQQARHRARRFQAGKVA